MEILSKVHSKHFVEWSRTRPEVLVLSADLTSSTECDLFRDTYPDRFYSMGVAEQNMVSMAAGLAREGFVPFIHTFAVFLYRRAYDQVAMSVAYPAVRVRLLGFLPGITTPGGATHQAIEDVALMRALPNMTVLECGDATELESFLDVTEQIDGPVYVRMLRGEVPRLFDAREPMRLGKARVLSRARESFDIALLSSGICTEEALRASRALTEKGVSIRHLHISTLKPFDDDAVREAVTEARCGVVTIENHVVTGGLGSAVAEVMAECGAKSRLVRLGIRDVFSHGASRPYLMREHGIDARSLISAIEKLLGEGLGISDDMLMGIRIEAVHSESKAEAL